jgi:saccharopine dehydrogenase-like NADP-dependent oxidoreductase
MPNCMKKVLILGAGLSASSLIRYLLEKSVEYNWQVRVVDSKLESVRRKLGGHPNGVALSFNALDPELRRPEIEQADLVISMLPARFHTEVAADCIALRKHLITPSYISPEMHELDAAAKEAGIVIMNEIGVDPGIDHMSAMQIIDTIRSKGGEITSFKSYCGGLIAPESDDNPWNYKFTWNPRNVVLAGSGGGAARYIDRREYKYIPYTQIFSRLDAIEIDGFGMFDGYANRDSLSYRPVYGLEDIPTFYRGTLRRPGFCQYWNILVNLGMTDDSYTMQHSEQLTPRNFLNAFLPYEDSVSVEDKLAAYCRDYEIEDLERFRWLGLFDNTQVIGLEDASPAQLLEKILVEKWVLGPQDKDMIVMVHQFIYQLDGEEHTIESSMVNIGEDEVFTSMSNLVGLPVAMCAKMILNGTLTDTGVQVPIAAHVYNPILEELSEYGVRFMEREGKLMNC